MRLRTAAQTQSGVNEEKYLKIDLCLTCRKHATVHVRTRWMCYLPTKNENKGITTNVWNIIKIEVLGFMKLPSWYCDVKSQTVLLPLPFPYTYKNSGFVFLPLSFIESQRNSRRVEVVKAKIGHGHAAIREIGTIVFIRTTLFNYIVQ